MVGSACSISDLLFATFELVLLWIHFYVYSCWYNKTFVHDEQLTKLLTSELILKKTMNLPIYLTKFLKRAFNWGTTTSDNISTWK